MSTPAERQNYGIVEFVINYCIVFQIVSYWSMEVAISRAHVVMATRNCEIVVWHSD